MKKIAVKAEHEYSVVIGDQWSQALLPFMDNRTRVGVIVSSNFSPNLDQVKSVDAEVHIFQIPDGEAGKSSATLLKLWDWLGAAGFTRSDLIVGIGGGAVTDLSGFVAATWLRGIDWVAIPTSLAGMVDASVGGKTGINSDYGKNLIGAFHSPRAVIIDPKFLHTLPTRDLSAGMAEVIKCGFIDDSKILDIAGNLTTDSLLQEPDLLLELIGRAVEVKAKVVTADFKESFAREVLNYGHTLGHAIEKYSKYELRHGEAVAVGMIFAAELAFARGLISAQLLALHRQLLMRFNLPVSYQREAWQKLAPLLALDKKSRGKTIRFVVLNGVGSTLRLEDLTSHELDSAYERICT